MKTSNKGLFKTTIALVSTALAFGGIAPFAVADEATPEPTTGTVAVEEAPVEEQTVKPDSLEAAPEVNDDVVVEDNKVSAPAAVNSTSVGVNANSRTSSNAINTSNREAVRAAFINSYLNNDRQVLTSVGADVARCDAGSVNPEAADMVMDVWNFYRGMNNLDAVKADPASPLSNYVQQAALVQAAGNTKGTGLSHTPGRNWPCYSREAFLGSSQSNLAQSTGQTPAEQIQWWFQDWSGNANPSTMTSEGFNDVLGHRNWLMDPYISESAYGNVGGFNALAVASGVGFDSYSVDRMVNRNATVPETMAWPSAGYFPTELMTSVERYRNDVERWSFRVLNGKMNNVNVKVTGPNGKNVPVRVVKTGMKYAPNTVGNYGTVLFKMDRKNLTMPKGTGEAVYTVKVSGVKNAAKSTYTYKVKLFNATEANMKPQVVVHRAPIALENNTSMRSKVTVVGANAKVQWQISEDQGKTWKNAPRINNLAKGFHQPDDLRWAAGVGTCKREGRNDYTACPMTYEQSENVRFRVRATNNYGTSYSEPMQAIFLGFSNDFPATVKAGQKLTFDLAFDGNGDTVQPTNEYYWQSPNGYKFYSTNEPVFNTSGLSGKKVQLVYQVRIGEGAVVNYVSIKSPVITIR